MEITASNIIYQGNSLDAGFDRKAAEAIYQFLLSLGALKDITFHWHEVSGQITIMKKFIYGIDDRGEKLIGDQMYSLSQYIKLLYRFDKSAYNRMKNVEKKIAKMEAVPRGLRAQLKN